MVEKTKKKVSVYVWIIIGVLVLLVGGAFAAWKVVDLKVEAANEHGITMESRMILNMGQHAALNIQTTPENLDVNIGLEGDSISLEGGNIVTKKNGITKIVVKEKEDEKLAKWVNKFGEMFHWSYAPVETACEVTVVTAIGNVCIENGDVELTLNGENSVKLNAVVSPEGVENVEFTYSVENVDIANVDVDGTLRGVAVGETSVKVVAENERDRAEDSVKVKVINKLEKIILDKETLELTEGGTDTITASLYPEDAQISVDVQWDTSDASVATVDQDGKVTAVKAGNATITAFANASEVTAECNVTVKEKKVVTKSTTGATGTSAGGGAGGAGGTGGGSSSGGYMGADGKIYGTYEEALATNFLTLAQCQAICDYANTQWIGVMGADGNIVYCTGADHGYGYDDCVPARAPYEDTLAKVLALVAKKGAGYVFVIPAPDQYGSHTIIVS